MLQSYLPAVLASSKYRLFPAWSTSTPSTGWLDQAILMWHFTGSPMHVAPSPAAWFPSLFVGGSASSGHAHYGRGLHCTGWGQPCRDGIDHVWGASLTCHFHSLVLESGHWRTKAGSVMGRTSTETACRSLKWTPLVGPTSRASKVSASKVGTLSQALCRHAVSSQWLPTWCPHTHAPQQPGSPFPVASASEKAHKAFCLLELPSLVHAVIIAERARPFTALAFRAWPTIFLLRGSVSRVLLCQPYASTALSVTFLPWLWRQHLSEMRQGPHGALSFQILLTLLTHLVSSLYDWVLLAFQLSFFLTVGPEREPRSWWL